MSNVKIHNYKNTQTLKYKVLKRTNYTFTLFTLRLHYIYIMFTLRLHYDYITFTLHYIMFTLHYVYITFTLCLHYVYITFTLRLHYVYITFTLHLHYTTDWNQIGRVAKMKENHLHVAFLLPLLEVSQGVCVCWFLYPLNHLEIFEMMTVRRMTRGLAAG